jgi:FkbM family methyltransferase
MTGRRDRTAADDAVLAAAAAQHGAAPPALAAAVTVETDVGPLYLPAGDSIILPYLQEHGLWAPELTRLVRECVGAGMRFVDVGAHVGYFAVLAGKLVGPDGVVFAFEPHPRNFELLLANLWRNGLTNVLCFPWAVTDSCGFADLFEAPANSGDHRIYRSPDEERAAIPVRTVAVDAVAIIRPPVDFVKLDVQGAEPAAIRGMTRLLAASPAATVALEHWPFGLQRFGEDAGDALAYYRRLGYAVRVNLPDHDRPVVLSDEEILELCSEWDGFGHADLVLRREGDAPARSGDARRR